jgi:hypothetical protein
MNKNTQTMKHKKHNTARDLMKAVKAKNRLDEIKLHGKPLNHSHVERTKKLYTRKIKHRKLLYIN